MASTTVVIPFALPPKELAADIARALQTPSLATLLSRNSLHERRRFESDARVLPHEAWLSPGKESAPLAAAVMRGFGMAQPEGYWFIVHPVHVQLSRTHLTMADPRNLHLDEADSRALFETAKPYFNTLLYGDANTWFMRADDWSELDTASPDAAMGNNLADWMPTGPNALGFKKLQNEVQMLWHEHPVNQAREARRLPPVNSFWMWGGAGAASPSAAASPVLVADAPAWMQALGTPELRSADVTRLLATPGERRTAVLGHLLAPGLAGDWSAWLAEMQRLEQEWFTPLLAAVLGGRAGDLTLVLTDRDGVTSFRTSKMAQRQFWRMKNLKSLTT
jgi:hypothetical protein